MNPAANFSSYLLPSVFNPRYHQHLNHLNDMAFTHTKMLQDIIEKRSMDSLSSPSSPSSSSISPMAATSNDSSQLKKRTHSANIDHNNEQQQQQKQDFSTTKRSKMDDDDDGEDEDNHLSQRSRKQLKTQQVVRENNQTDDDDDNDEQSASEEEIGEVPDQDEKQVFYINIFYLVSSIIFFFRIYFQQFHNHLHYLFLRKVYHF